jgi:hypothetical protein
VGEANRMRGGKYTDRGNTFLLATLGPEDEIFLGLFIIAACWALFSGAVVFSEHPRNGAEIGLALGHVPGGVAGYGLLLLEAALWDFSYGS